MSKWTEISLSKGSSYPATDVELVHSSFPNVTTLNSEKSEIEM